MDSTRNFPKKKRKEKTWLFFRVEVAAKAEPWYHKCVSGGLCIVEKNLLELTSYSSKLPYQFLLLLLKSE